MIVQICIFLSSHINFSEEEKKHMLLQCGSYLHILVIVYQML